MTVKQAHRRMIGLVTVVIVLVVVLAGWFVHDRMHTQHAVQDNSSANAVANQFNTAMATGNSATVLALESEAFKNHLKVETTNEKNTRGEHGAIVTDNYYIVAKADDELNEWFKPSVLSGAKVSFGSYQAANGTRGVSVLLSEANNVDGKVSYAPSFAVELVPSGTSWLVDGVMPYATATANQ